MAIFHTDRGNNFLYTFVWRQQTSILRHILHDYFRKGENTAEVVKNVCDL